MRNETHHHPCTHEGCTKSFRSKVKLQNHMSTEHDGTNCGAFLCDQVTLHFLYQQNNFSVPFTGPFKETFSLEGTFSL